MMRSGFIVISIIIIIPFSAARAVWFDVCNGVCVEPFSQYDPAIVSDGAGGAIIVWSDQRSGTADNDIYAQRISPDGDLLWGEDGIAVCIASESQDLPVARSDGQGGVIVYWMDERAGSAVYRQVYAQRLDSSGSRLWTTGGLLISGMVWNEYLPGFTVDRDGNSLFSWLEQGPYTYLDVHAQKVAPDGSFLWGSTGTVVCDSLYYPYDCDITTGADGGAVVTWSMVGTGPWYSGSIFAQRLDDAGSAIWTANGLVVYEEVNRNSDLFTAPGAGGGAWIVWRSYEVLAGDTKVNLEIDMVYINTLGVTQGGPLPKSIAADEDFLSLPAIDINDSNELVVAWSEDVAGSQKILCQKIDTMGNHVWNEFGISVCPEVGDQFDPDLTGDGAGGHIVTWTNIRTGIDIYAQQIDGNGDIQWGIPGTPVCGMAGVQESPAITTDMAGGAIVTWMDNREITHTDIYAGRVASDGDVVPTQIQSWSVLLEKTGVVLRWSLSNCSPGGVFVVERAEVSRPAEWTVMDGGVEETGINAFAYSDGTALPGKDYIYRVSSLDEEGRVVLFESDPVTVPRAVTSLGQNRPNPFNPSTVIEYYLPVRENIVIEIYDVAGRSVSRVAEGIVDAGEHSATWNGTDSSGDPVSSGVYFYILRAGKETLRRKMVLLR